MKSGMPWGLKGVDEETREAVYEAARRAGMSVSEWLNATVGDYDSAHDEDDPSTIAAALGRLTKRLRSMSESARAAVPDLVRRLDEIERSLGGPSGAVQPSGSLKRISAMVEKLARDIEDADENARTMIEGQRAGANTARVTEAIRDLDRRIARLGERATTPREEAPAPLDDIRTRLNSLLAERPKASEPKTPVRTATIDAALRGLEARIDEAKARLIAPYEQPVSNPQEAEQIARIEKRLSDIGNRLADRGRASAPPAPDPAPAKATDLAAAIAEISAHQRLLDEQAEALSRNRDQDALAATMAALRADIAGLTEQVANIGRFGAEDKGVTFDLARRIEALSTDRPLDRSLLNSIRADVEALRNAIEANSGESALHQIETRFAAMGERLDALGRGPDRTRLDALGSEVSAIRRALESDDSPRAIQRLEMRMAELARSVEVALAGNNGGPDIDQAVQQFERRLEAMTDDIAARLSTPATPVASVEIERLEQRLDSLSRSIVATLAERNAPVAPAVAQRLEDRLDEIAARVDDLLDRAPAIASMVTMQARVQSLVEAIEGLTASQREPTGALDEIKSEIAAIRRDMAERGAPDTDHLERQIRDLAERLDASTRVDDGGAGLAELEAQVAHLASQIDGDQPRGAALHHVEESLDRLQTLFSSNHRESIEAARAEARAAVQELSGTLEPRGVDSDLIQALRQDLNTLRTAVAGGSAAAAAEPTAKTLSQVASRLDELERVTAADDRATGTHGAAVVADAGAPAKKPATDRRADFIAAARRAAQAAAAEASRVEAPAAEPVAEAGESKTGAFARISQAIRSRKRPLLLAAAAIVLAIGAMQVYDTFVGGNAKTSSIVKTPTATAAAKTPGIADILASADASHTGAGNAALVAPATPDAKVTFAAPEAFDSRFGNATSAPQANAFSGDAKAPVDTLPQPAPTSVALTSAASAPPLAQDSQGPALDPAIGSDKLVQAARSGDAAAAFEVAARYADGDRIAKDLGKAAEWYQRAAEGGVAVAQYRLGSLYERGQGVAKDLTKAVDWYQRAADQGNVNAMHNLAVMMSEGVDGSPDQDKALQWFLAAADYGVRDSQYNLGVIFARGLGTPQDLIASYKWFAIAAAQGDSDSTARRDEVAKLLSGDDLAKARAAVQAWHAKPPLAEANGVSAPDGGWDGPGSTLGETDRQALVKKIQTLLAEQGFDPGPADGVAGAKTRDAVKAYQRQNGIAETGQIDTSLMTALADQGT